MASAFLAFSCSSVIYNKVYRIDDEFRDNVKHYTRVNIRPADKRTEIGSARITLEKVVNKEGEAVNAYFVINRSSSSFKADNAGFIKAGDKKFEISLLDPVSEFKSRSEAAISGLATVDTSGLVTGQTPGIDTRTWIEDKFVVTLSQEVVMGISEAKDVIFRFYFGPIPATYKLEGYKLLAVQKVLKQ
jgi:hypothetical protein